MTSYGTKYYNVTPNISEIKPLDPLFINELKRSSYFDNEFTPML